MILEQAITCKQAIRHMMHFIQSGLGFELPSTLSPVVSASFDVTFST